jgi:hypothetical protein
MRIYICQSKCKKEQQHNKAKHATNTQQANSKTASMYSINSKQVLSSESTIHSSSVQGICAAPMHKASMCRKGTQTQLVILFWGEYFIILPITREAIEGKASERIEYDRIHVRRSNIRKKHQKGRINICAHQKYEYKCKYALQYIGIQKKTSTYVPERVLHVSTCAAADAHM